MPIPKKLINYLEREKVKYVLIPHRVVYTAWDLAQTLHVKPQQVVKTLVVKLKNKVPLLVLLPAHKQVDKKKLSNVVYNEVQKINRTQARAEKADDVVPYEWNFPSQALKGKSYSVNFASEKWVKEKLLGKMGATPPFGRLLRVPIIIDSSLLKEKELILNSGDYKTAIVMSRAVFEKLERPLSGSLSIIKKK